MGFQRAVLAGILLASSAFVGCGGGYAAFRVGAPPPPSVVGAIGVAPGPGFLWVDGFWDLRGSRWVWVDGRWARPPRGRTHWEPDRWERHGDRWRYNRGHWR